MSNPIDAFTIKTSHYIIGAMALVAGLGWKDTIRDIINENFPISNENIRVKISFSIIITILVVILIYILPDTKKELPQSTQEKIKELEDKNRIEHDITALKFQILVFKTQNDQLKNELKRQQNS